MSPSEAYEVEAARSWHKVVTEVSHLYPDVDIRGWVEDVGGVHGYARLVHHNGRERMQSEVEVGCSCSEAWMGRILRQAVEDLRRHPIEVQAAPARSLEQSN